MCVYGCMYIYIYIYIYIYYYCCYRFSVLDYLILLICVGMCVCNVFFLFFSISFLLGLLYLRLLLWETGALPREVISVTYESSWLSRHTIIYINYIYFVRIYFLCIFMVVLCGANIYFNFNFTFRTTHPWSAYFWVLRC